jgi:hypothetical protein
VSLSGKRCLRVAENVSPEDRLVRFKSWLCHLPTVDPSTNYLTSQVSISLLEKGDHSFLRCVMRIKVHHPHKVLYVGKHLPILNNNAIVIIIIIIIIICLNGENSPEKGRNERRLQLSRKASTVCSGLGCSQLV